MGEPGTNDFAKAESLNSALAPPPVLIVRRYAINITTSRVVAGTNTVASSNGVPQGIEDRSLQNRCGCVHGEYHCTFIHAKGVPQGIEDRSLQNRCGCVHGEDGGGVAGKSYSAQ